MLTRLKKALRETASKPSFRIPVLTVCFFAGLGFARFCHVPFAWAGTVALAALCCSCTYAGKRQRLSDAALMAFACFLGITMLSLEPHRRTSGQFIQSKEVKLPWCVAFDDAAGRAFRAHMDEQHAAFAEGLVLGRGKIDRDIMKLFKDAGTAHAVAISGTHVIIIAGVLYLFVTMFNMPIRWRSGVAAVLVIVYGALCYFKVPVLRSVVMYAAFCGACVLQRPFLPYHTLFLAGLVTTLYDPVSMFTVSFQLSFAAVLGLMLGNDLLMRYGFYAKKLTRVKKYIAVPIYASLFATLLTTPITSFYFGKVYLLSWFSSLIAVPMLTVVIYVIAVYALVCALPLLAAPVALTMTALIDANIVTNAFFAKIPGMSVPFKMPLVAVVWYYVVLLVAWIIAMHWKDIDPEKEIDVRIE
jgi:ComEC/Rec2-related protein